MRYGPRTVEDFRGKQFKSLTSMANFWRADPKLVTDRINRGWSTRDALMIASGQKRINHNASFTLPELADIYGVDLDILKCTMQEYEEFEEAVRIARWVDVSNKTALNNRDFKAISFRANKKVSNTAVVDHAGITHTSFNRMCKYYGASPSTVKHRIKTGWSLNDALNK